VSNNTTGDSNVAIGVNALQNNIGGGGNSALGLNFLRSNTVGGGTPACPSTSVILYTDTALKNVFDGLFQYWRSSACGSSYYILDTGFIEGITACD
jgi:hypothetical protein